MNILSSDKGPFLLTLLLAVLTWQVGEIVATLQAGQPLLYEIDIDRTGTIDEPRYVARLSIENASQSAAIKDFEFLMVCPDQSDCFVGQDAQIVAIPPTFTRGITIQADNSFVGLKGLLAAGGRLIVEGELNRDVGDLRAIFVIDPDNPSDAFALRASTLRGFMVRNYFVILSISGLVVAVVLFFWITFGGIREWQSNRSREATDPPPDSPDPQPEVKKGNTAPATEQSASAAKPKGRKS